jgi:hypothetical protein
MWVCCAEKFYKFSPNLTELLFNGPAEIAEMAEIFILTQRRRGRRVLFEHGLNGLILFLEFTNDVFNDVQITEGVKECGWIVQ